MVERSKRPKRKKKESKQDGRSLVEKLRERQANRSQFRASIPSERRMEVLQFAADHPEMSDADIGKKFDIARQTVSLWIKKFIQSDPR